MKLKLSEFANLAEEGTIDPALREAIRSAIFGVKDIDNGHSEHWLTCTQVNQNFGAKLKIGYEL